MFAQRVAPLAFENVAAIAEQAPVEAPPVGDLGLGGAGVAHDQLRVWNSCTQPQV
jgi:hypothetical protein